MAKKAKQEEAQNVEIIPVVKEVSIPDVEVERERITDEFLKSRDKEISALPNQPDATTTDVVVEKKGVETKPGEIKTEEGVSKTDYVKAETPATKPETVEKEKEVKTVPYDALHEEREKRKFTQKKLRDVEERLNQVINENRLLNESLIAKPDNPKEVVEGNYFDDPLIKNLQSEIKILKQQEANRGEKVRQQEQQNSSQRLFQKIRDIDAELEKEGYPVFGLMLNSVKSELQALIKEDPENDYLDTPDGWKKVYKEKVFPQIKNKFITETNKESILSKEKLKREAQLAGSAGKVIDMAENKEDYTYSDYIADRMKAQAG